MTSRRNDVIRPRALRPGARIALVAPAGPLEPDRIDRSAERCRSLGLEPVVFPAAAARHGYLAGTDSERLGDLQAAFDDLTIDGVWALRGGYGTLRILDGLSLERQRRAPIPFIGFSDNTTVHIRHVHAGVVSFHGPHPGAEFPPETAETFRRVLFSAEPAGPLLARPEDPQPRAVVSGRAEGRLVGGNLAMLASLCGSRDALVARGCILFLEEVGEAAYRVDRTLRQLERAGALEGLAGLALGRFTEVPTADEQRLPGVIGELAERLAVPTVVDLPFGHVEHNSTLPMGSMGLLDADAGTLTLTEPAVTLGGRLPGA